MANDRTAARIAVAASATCIAYRQHLEKRVYDYNFIGACCDTMHTLSELADPRSTLACHLASICDAMIVIAQRNEHRINPDAVASALYLGSGL